MRGATAFRCDRAVLAAVAAASALGAPAAARAQPTDRALAESLFEQARALMSADKVPAACAKFAESYRLDPALGTLLNLAVCHEKQGRIASAWAEFKDAAAEARATRQPDRETMAKRHADALEPRLARFVLSVAEGAPDSLEIRVDGVVIGRPAWGTKLPIDPGKHRVEARAEGKRPWSQDIVVPDGAADVSVEVPELEPAAAARAEPPVVAPVAPMAPPPRDREEPRSPPLRTVGFVTAGVGLVGLGLGTYFGLRTLSLKDDRDAHCDGAHACDSDGVALDHDARNSATISTIAFVAGAALMAGGIVLVATAPRAGASARRVEIRFAGTGGSVGARW